MKKFCKKCQIEKDIIHFSKCKIFKDGYWNKCKDCLNLKPGRAGRVEKIQYIL